MWKWVIAQNIARLEKRLSECSDERERAILKDLLKREKDRARADSEDERR